MIEKMIIKLINEYQKNEHLTELLDNFRFEKFSNILDEYERFKQIIIKAVRCSHHRKRLPKFTMKLMEYVLSKEDFVRKIMNCQTFDDIQNVILLANVEYDRIRMDNSEYCELFDTKNPAYGLPVSHIKFGELAVYDTALYIGYSNSIFPNRVFLYQNGSEKGASCLKEMKLLKYYNVSVLNISDFSEIITSRLKSYQIEDFLCVKKAKLAEILNKYYYNN
jgi:hypothetical protein